MKPTIVGWLNIKKIQAVGNIKWNNKHKILIFRLVRVYADIQKEGHGSIDLAYLAGYLYIYNLYVSFWMLQTARLKYPVYFHFVLFFAPSVFISIITNSFFNLPKLNCSTVFISLY